MIKFTDKFPFARVRFIVKYIEENIENFKTRLISRGYPEQMVEKTLWKVKYKDRKEAPKQKMRLHKKLLPFLTQFQPSLPKFEKHHKRQMLVLNAKPTSIQRDIQGVTIDFL